MTDRIRIIKHEAVPRCGSYEVRFTDGRESKFFYFDDVPSRRLRERMMLTGKQALEQARAFARGPSATGVEFAPGAGAAYVYRMTELPGIFTVNCYDGKHWVAVSPNHEPHHQGFDRQQLRAANLAALQGNPANDDSRRRCTPESYPADVPGGRRRAARLVQSRRDIR
jgi:hypothetical protein